MEALFLEIFNMSISTGWLILCTLLLRLILKKAPKNILCLLWSLAGIRLTVPFLRLIVPFSFESALSLIPSAEIISPETIYSQSPSTQSGIPAVNSVINPVISSSLSPEAGASVNPIQILLFIFSVIWLSGIAVMLAYGIISYILLRRKVRVSMRLYDNIYLCDSIASPFILGLIKPGIYLPSDISEKQKAHVIPHEKAHLKRLDHIWKPLGFILLTLYWFDPLVWISYILFCRDIETACDERVIKSMTAEEKRAYSETLLSFTASRYRVAVCPLTFGEIGIKSRIRAVANYKKPEFWMICTAVIACIAAAAMFMMDPSEDRSDIGGSDPPAVTYEVSISPADYTDSGEILTGALNLSEMMMSGVLHLPIYKFDSMDELQKFKADFADIITVPQGYDEAPSFDEATKKYDGAFFEDGVLFAVYVSADSGSLRFDVGEIYNDGKSFIIHVTEKNHTGDMTGDMAGWLITVAADRELTASCTEFDAVLNNMSFSGENAILYEYSHTKDPLPAKLILSEKSNSFQFHYSAFSSHIAAGTYALEGDILTLTSNDAEKKTYFFKKEGDAFIFDAHSSSELPKYRYSANAEAETCVPDGAVFKRAESK